MKIVIRDEYENTDIIKDVYYKLIEKRIKAEIVEADIEIQDATDVSLIMLIETISGVNFRYRGDYSVVVRHIKDSIVLVMTNQAVRYSKIKGEIARILSPIGFLKGDKNKWYSYIHSGAILEDIGKLKALHELIGEQYDFSDITEG